MIIDCHGHYTTAPKALEDWRSRQIAGIKDPSAMPKVSELRISDDELRESIEKNQLKQSPPRRDWGGHSRRVAKIAKLTGSKLVKGPAESEKFVRWKSMKNSEENSYPQTKLIDAVQRRRRA